MALALKSAQKLSSSSRQTRAAARPRVGHLAVVRSHKVEIDQNGEVHVLDVPEGRTILEVALDKGLDLPHDCKLGVCMTCPAKLVRFAQHLWSGLPEQDGMTACFFHHKAACVSCVEDLPGPGVQGCALQHENGAAVQAT